MRFLLDVHHIGSRATGNETWARETALALLRLTAATDERIALAASVPLGEEFSEAESVDRIGGGAVARLARELPALVRRRSADALLVQYTRALTRVPTVVAVHDLSFTAPESAAWIPPRERARMNTTIRWSARTASVVVALSEHTSRDLTAQWDVDPSRIVVAPPAVSPAFLDRLGRLGPRVEHRPGLAPTVLIVGNVLPRKNHAVVIDAVRRLRAKGVPARVVVAGQVPPAGAEYAQQVLAGTEGWVTVTGYLSDDDLVRAYLEADVLCYASLYEGFGIPVLEAMAADLPVLVSDATALPEAAGSAGRVLPSHDPTAWASALEQVLTAPGAADAMRAAGREHVARFSWDATADVVLAALRRAAG